MTPLMKAFFETENLMNASPATVSRAGIIYVSESELGWQPVVASWLATRRAGEAAALRGCFDKYVDRMLDFNRLNLKQVMGVEAVSQVRSLLTLLEGALLKGGGPGAEPPGGAAGVERTFLFCLAWSLGALLDQGGQAAFDGELRTLTAALPKKAADGDTLFEWLVKEDGSGWAPWREQVPAWTFPREGDGPPRFSRMLVPTVDSVRYEHLLGLVWSVQKASLLVGGPGTAKTATIAQFLGRLPAEETATKTINFSSLTSPSIFQATIEGCVEKRQGRTYGPPGGRVMAVVIDDLSMPALNEWGDQITNEIVRQLLEQGGMYCLDKPIGDMRYITDCRYLAAMNTPGAGKHDIPNRLKRQFAIFNVPLPSPAAIERIFGSIIQGHFNGEAFSGPVVETASKLVGATLALWQRVAARMLPTPAKFHYLFNMRELSRVFQGIILAAPDRFGKGAAPAPYGGKVTSPEGYLGALWVHECERVFADKMNSAGDKAWVEGAVKDLAKQHFSPEVARQLEEPLYFVDFLRDPVVDAETGETLVAHPSFYESVAGGLPDVKRKVEALQARFNEESRVAKLELVLFKDALLHLMRLSRLLAMARGNALLAGVGGSGKQSLARLAAYVAGAYTFQITVTKTYNLASLFEDLRALYKVAGLKGQPVAFIFTDAEVKEEGFLEYINQLLMTGEVAGLFPKEDLDALLNDLRPAFKRECPGVPDTQEKLYAFLLERVRERLHVVMCFSPIGAQFARRAQQFPGLINGATVDWFLPWPEEALIAVSSKFIDDFQMSCTPAVKDSLKTLMGQAHASVTLACAEYHEKFRRRVYVTPKSYLSFLEGYRGLYTKKLAHTRALAASIASGLHKMNEAKVDVNRMKGELALKNVELAAASKEAEKLLAEISANTALAEKEKQKVAVIVEAVSKTAAEIAVVKDDAERDLAAAKPALEAALSALNSITPKDITGLKALKNPPDVVKRIFDCVLLLRHFSVGKVGWQDVKGSMVLMGSYDEAVKMMGDTQFLTALLNFPKEGINDETVELLQPYFAAPDFNYESAKKASGNVAGLCNWAEAMCTYHKVAVVVEPKIVTLRRAEGELKVATREKNTALEQLALVQAKLDEMQASFDAAMRQKQALQDDALATQRRMDAANALLGALAGEEVRWTEQSKAFDDQIQRLTGDCALACGFVSYLGPFNKEFRELLLTREFGGACARLGIPATRHLSVAAFLVDEAEVGEWTLQGLPTDELSVQNGILVTRATRWPVLVDPQGQGRAWLAQREAASQLRITTLGDKQFRNILEDCLTFGKPLLVENMEEELDPALDPVLEKRIQRKGRGLTLQLADKEVDYCETFRLFFTTRLGNPHFTPELSAKVLVVDFTVTAAGLEDQLLGVLILKEKAELEQQRLALMEEVQSYRKKIKQLEDDLLFRLSNSQGNLLDDTKLIGVLAVTKATAAEVNERLAGASEAKKKIGEACEEYRPVAHRAQLVYFLIARFALVDVMYQTSLKQFNALYELAIDTAERAALPARRIANITDHLTYSIYLYVQRGLFERHKLTFALMLTLSILVSAGKVKAEDVDNFLKGGNALDINSVKKKPKEWVPDRAWLNVVALASMDAFREVVDGVERAEGAWRGWYDAEAPERAPVPGLEERLSKFERMCIVKAWRQDRTLIAAADFIADALGQRFVESVPLAMERVWAESGPLTPVICLLSPGADPTKLIEDLAKRKKVKTLGISMGQGQEIIARRYLATAAAEGQWLLLQNTHLGLKYLAELEGVLGTLEGVHEGFRLWITAEPHPEFPIGLLQMGIKVTNEAPVGLKAGLRASYQWVSQDMLDAVNRPEWPQLLYVMCFLHSVVQERRKFGPIGWNVPYEFNQSDLAACTIFLQNHLLDVDAKRAAGPTWETVRYMVAAIQYGGRITDEFDKLLMETFAERYFHQAVLGQGYELYREGKGFAYTVPRGNEVEVYRKAVEELPPQESPEVFGLHANADLTFRTLQVSAAVQLILDTQPAGAAAGGGLSREEVVDRIAEDLLAKVPPLFDKEATKEKLRKLAGGPTQPLTVHLRQEVDRLNTVLALAAATLKNLRLAIAGTVALNEGLLESMDALFNARIPKDWLRRSWEASTLGNWFLGLLQRHDQLSRWLNTGRPKAFWLTGFFNPQGFLTAVKQEVSRRHAADKWALDDVVLTSEVVHPAKEVDAIREGPAEGVYVYGLHLDGAAWSARENRLVDSEPKKLYHPLPVLFITGVLAKDRKRSGVFEAPCYRVRKRTGLNFITQFALRTDDPPSKWVLRGVALLCSID